MNVQIFGFRDCQETRKALRFFSERRVAVHFVDMDEKPATRGELRRFAERLGAASMIDREGRRFRDLGLRVAGDSPERLIERALVEPRLLRTPLVRGGRQVAVGGRPDTWQEWVDAERRTPATPPAASGEPRSRPAR